MASYRRGDIVKVMDLSAEIETMRRNSEEYKMIDNIRLAIKDMRRISGKYGKVTSPSGSNGNRVGVHFGEDEGFIIPTSVITERESIPQKVQRLGINLIYAQ